MSLLNRLRQQAEQTKLGEMTEDRRVTYLRDEVEAVMQRVLPYLTELRDHLLVLKPASKRRFNFDANLTLADFVMDEFYVSSREIRILDKDVIEYHMLAFKYVSPREVVVARTSKAEIDRLEKLLLSSRIPYDIAVSRNDQREVVRANFKFNAVIPAAIRIKGEHDTGTITILAKNVDRLDAYELEFDLEQVNDDLLEMLAAYLLGESDKFRSSGRFKFRKRAEEQQ